MVGEYFVIYGIIDRLRLKFLISVDVYIDLMYDYFDYGLWLVYVFENRFVERVVVMVLVLMILIIDRI